MKSQRKLSMLQLAQELRSVSEACRLMGYSRSQFYEIKRAFQTGGLTALLDKAPIPGSTPHKIPEELEKEEYRGKEGMHPYELFLALNDIDHRFTKVGTPRTNGFVERFNRTVLDEFFREAFRKKFYGSVDELQADLDKWVNHYNHERPHRGYRNQGRKPYETFTMGKKEIAKHRDKKEERKGVKKAA